jgi:hypothetical protein
MFRFFIDHYQGDHIIINKYKRRSTIKYSKIVLAHCSKSWYLEQRTEVQNVEGS